MRSESGKRLYKLTIPSRHLRRLSFISIASLFGLAWGGCRSVKTSQKSGTEFDPTNGAKSPVQTYVTPEEYEKMSPQERERVHASVGVNASMPLWGVTEKSPKTVSSEDLDKSRAAAKNDP